MCDGHSSGPSSNVTASGYCITITLKMKGENHFFSWLVVTSANKDGAEREDCEAFLRDRERASERAKGRDRVCRDAEVTCKLEKRET